MRYKKLKLSAMLVMGLWLTVVHAQKTVTVTGGNGSGTGGSVSYSVGQVIYTYNTGATGSVIQGVQQPYEISVVTGIEEGKTINLVFWAFPNPATDFVKLKVEDYKTDNLTYQLYDISGNTLESKKIEGNETSISIRNLVPSIYFLKVKDHNKELKTFKIIKK
jgi:hypothetical protein